MRILFVTPYVPSLVRIRPFNLIKYLGQRHAISVLALQQDGRESEHIHILNRYCERIETVHLSKARSLVSCLRALPSKLPLQGAYCYSNALIRRTAQILSESHYDLVHVEHLRGAYLGRWLEDVPRVYDSVDCISLLLERTLRNGASPLAKLLGRIELPRTRTYEALMLECFDRVLVTSHDDKIALERLKGGHQLPHLRVVPNGVHLGCQPNGPSERDPNAIVFSGKMSYHANSDAVRYFCREVLPLVREVRPEVTFTIAGSNPTREVQALGADSGVRVTGHVADIRPYLRRAAIAVVPIRYAVGIQNKVLEAMAMGTPVVATPMACRALVAVPERDLLVGDGAPAFASEVIRLLEDVELRTRIGASGRRFVEDNHEWSAVADHLSTIYEEVIAARPRRQGPAVVIRQVADLKK